MFEFWVSPQMLPESEPQLVLVLMDPHTELLRDVCETSETLINKRFRVRGTQNKGVFSTFGDKVTETTNRLLLSQCQLTNITGQFP